MILHKEHIKENLSARKCDGNPLCLTLKKEDQVMGYENVGRVWTSGSLAQYLATIKKPVWCEAVTLHHTAEPSLAQRPNGLLIKHIENIRDWYITDKGWSAGPHLFIDEDQIFGMCDLRKKGVHAVSFNKSAIGIEVLGNYESEDPKKGRGLACWKNAAAAARVLLDWLDLDANEETILFHRDDPTTKKSCPGAKVKKDWVLGLIARPTAPQGTETDKPDVGMSWSSWDFRGERWCVPVYKFLVAKGISSATIISNLKSKGGKFFFGEELLEGAYYVRPDSSLKPNDCTWAPAAELMDLV